MTDAELIDKVAKLWVELGGDGDGVEWRWRDLRDRVDELAPIKQIEPTGNKPGRLSRR
jgi:hypothetical protein